MEIPHLFQCLTTQLADWYSSLIKAFMVSICLELSFQGETWKAHLAVVSICLGLSIYSKKNKNNSRAYKGAGDVVSGLCYTTECVQDASSWGSTSQPVQPFGEQCWEKKICNTIHLGRFIAISLTLPRASLTRGLATMHFKTQRIWGFTNVPDAANVSIRLIFTHTHFAAKGIWSRFPSIPPPLYLFRILVSGPGLQYNQEGSQLPYRGRNEQKRADQVRENRPGYASFSVKADMFKIWSKH